MPAAYDHYDYPSFWKGREYEHEAEVIALKAFLKKIPRPKKIVEIGSGYGRLVPVYSEYSDKIVLSDPSSKLLKMARKRFEDKNILFVQAKIENLGDKIRNESADLIILIRVLHHIKVLEDVFYELERISKNKGYLILEFANKRHLKAVLSQFFRGNFTFPLDIFPKDVKGKKLKKRILPFVNHHPDTIKQVLTRHNFLIIEERSVSNIRSPFLKRFVPKKVLLFFENLLQKPLAKIFFGPSVFLLAQKK